LYGKGPLEATECCRLLAHSPETRALASPHCYDRRGLRTFLNYFLEPFTSAWRRRKLLRELSHREILATFNGSMLGKAWLVLQPLLTLAVYATVFGGLLNLRGGDGGMTFVTSLFMGMIVYHAFTETVSRAPKLILSRPNYVTKVSFPLHLLPWPIVVLGAIHATISTLLLIVIHLIFVGTPAWTVVLLPAVIIPVLMLGLGVGWVLSSIGVYVRDTADITKVVLQLLFFLSPIVWSLQDIRHEDPEVRATISQLILCNPLAVAMETCRALLNGTPGPGMGWIIALIAITVLATTGGYAFFRRTKDGFADVL